MKIERSLSIFMILLYKRNTTIGALARQHEVSKRTIYRDISHLASAGFPIISSPGRGGGIGILPGYRPESHLFSDAGFSIMCETIAALGNMFDQSEIRSDARLASSLQSQNWFHWMPGRPCGQDTHNQLKARISAITDGISHEKCLAIEYATAQKMTNRSIEPLRLVLQARYWYVQAWCRLRSQYRLFRVDRIRQIKISGEGFNRSLRMAEIPEIDFDNLDKTGRESAKQGVLLRVHNASAMQNFCFLQKYSGPDEIFPRDILLPWPIDLWVENLLMMMSDQVEVLKPGHLRHSIAGKLSMGRNLYADTKES